jgi:hypothetical protein
MPLDPSTIPEFNALKSALEEAQAARKAVVAAGAQANEIRTLLRSARERGAEGGAPRQAIHALEAAQAAADKISRDYEQYTAEFLKTLAQIQQTIQESARTGTPHRQILVVGMARIVTQTLRPLIGRLEESLNVPGIPPRVMNDVEVFGQRMRSALNHLDEKARQVDATQVRLVVALREDSARRNSGRTEGPVQDRRSRLMGAIDEASMPTEIEENGGVAPLSVKSPEPNQPGIRPRR